jgi:hypothetical protein
MGMEAFTIVAFWFLAGWQSGTPSPGELLAAYRAELDAFRGEYGGARDLPNVRFFLFGMGNRTKYVYRDGRLMNVRSGAVVREWTISSDIIVPPEYLVALTTAAGPVSIREDADAVWIEESGGPAALEGTRRPVTLPDFSGYHYPRVLRVLHQEILCNISECGPVPNVFVYPRPWYRDGAMVAMVLRETGNLGLLRSWISGLNDPFDRNNGGETEADNLGQALFLVSLTADKHHPLVGKVLAESARFETAGAKGKFIQGRSDFAEHPVYQTKWLKYGLRALGLPDPYVVPSVADSYSALFWMEFKDAYVPGHDAADREAYPYLGWACDHFHRTRRSPISNRDYPLTWEERASQANYEGMRIVSPVYTARRLAAPHTWHAAEVFLYLLLSMTSEGARSSEFGF